MGRGIPMREIDGMDAVRYFDVLERELERKDEAEEDRRESGNGERGGGDVAYRRGMIDDVF